MQLGNRQTNIVVALVVILVLVVLLLLRLALPLQVANYYRKAIRQKQQAAEARQAKKQKINGPKGVRSFLPCLAGKFKFKRHSLMA